jgi:ankyrin repeat protein
MVEILIANGVDVNAQNESGKDALMLAAFNGKQKIVKTLREFGATYDSTDRSGSTAVHYAVDGGSVDTLTWMLLDGAHADPKDTTSYWTPLLRAASLNAGREICELLVKFGADVNARDSENKSVLIIAIINGNQPLVELLVDNGVDVFFKNEYGKNAYDLAVAMDRRRVIKYLDDYFERNKVSQNQAPTD